MAFARKHVYSILAGIVMLVMTLFFASGTPFFIPLILASVLLGVSNFLGDFIVKVREQKELEEQFPEFVRNLVSTIKSGMPVSKAILTVSRQDYGALTPYIIKLGNQVEWAIPIHKALYNFAQDTKNNVIKRAISTVIEAEVSGGNIEDVLETVTNSVIEIKKIAQERTASIHGQIVQSYVIFIVFLGVMITIQNLLIPYIADVGGAQVDITGGASIDSGDAFAESAIEPLLEPITVDFSSVGSFLVTVKDWMISIRGVFLMMAVLQAVFAGMVLGKLSTGYLKSGLKHSIILMVIASFVITFAQGLL